MCDINQLDEYYNGIRGYKVTCGLKGSIRTHEDAEEYTGMFGGKLLEITGKPVKVSLKSRETIGARYVIYKYSADGLGECRIIVDVETGHKIIHDVCLIETAAISKVSKKVARENYSPILVEAPTGVRDALPRGQKVIPKPVIYAVKGFPKINLDNWRLEVKGLVEKPLKLSYADLESMATSRVESMFHCVTGWSLGKNVWEGVSLRSLAEKAGVKNNAQWVLVRGVDGYTTVVPLEDFIHPQSLLVLRINGKPLSMEQGFPARIFIPHLYGWKHAKWVKEIIFRENYVDGYWETLGYHERGNVWLEERFKRSRCS